MVHVDPWQNVIALHVVVILFSSLLASRWKRHSVAVLVVVSATGIFTSTSTATNPTAVAQTYTKCRKKRKRKNPCPFRTSWRKLRHRPWEEDWPVALPWGPMWHVSCGWERRYVRECVIAPQGMEYYLYLLLSFIIYLHGPGQLSIPYWRFIPYRP